MSAEEHFNDLIPAYALGCLDDEESRIVTEHLQSCAVCQAELHTYQVVVEQLALAGPSMAPAPQVKDELISRIAIQKVVSSHQQAVSPGVSSQPSLRDRLAALFRRVTPAWGLASLALLLLLVTSNLLLWQQVRSLREATQQAWWTVDLTGTDAAPLATGLLVINQNGERGTLVVDGLPTLDEEHQYQLWLIDNGERTSGGVFSVGGSGYGAMVVYSPEPLASYSGFGVTIEPAGGSPGPTGERVLGGSLPSE